MSNYRRYIRTEKSRAISHKVNEDRVLFTEYSFMGDIRIRFIIVADGMGGLSEGDKASRHAVTAFAKYVYAQMMQIYIEHDPEEFSMQYYAQAMRDTVCKAIKAANREVCDQADPLVETGTTLSIIAIVGEYAIVANVGDSPVYYMDGQTKCLSLVSELQTKAEMDVAAGLYERYSREYYNNEHIIYHSLGEKEVLNDDDIFVKVIGYLHPGDMFLAGSDGAFGRMSEVEIEEIIEDNDEACILPELFSTARMDKDDDQTAVLYIVCEEE